MVNNGQVEPASPAPVSEPTATSPEPAAVPAATEPGAEEAAPRLARGEGRAPRDMLMSLAVLIVPIALLLLFYRFVLSGDAPVSIDPSATIQEAQQAKLFPIAVPQLGEDWHPSSATWTKQAGGSTLRIGYVDPGKDPVQLVESNVPPATLLPAELTDNAKPLSSFRAANGVWRLYTGRPGEQALVLAEADRTIILVGKTDEKSLEQLATSLS
jgi:hypothetical protein